MLKSLQNLKNTVFANLFIAWRKLHFEETENLQCLLCKLESMMHLDSKVFIFEKKLMMVCEFQKLNHYFI